MADNLELFAPQSTTSHDVYERAPLAEKLRPKVWEDYEGLYEIDKNLLTQLKSGNGRPPSLILWGPPGTGKTTLAKLIGDTFECHFAQLSAVLGGVKEVREIIAQSRRAALQTLLFVDEIHRFNKAQQDAFLPHVENGTIILIGATTENPSFYLTNALLSRVRVVPLESLNEESLSNILVRAEEELSCKIEPEAKESLAKYSGGDARRMLNALEGYTEAKGEKQESISKEAIDEFLKDAGSAYYDRDGDEHYNMASAFIKSMRGSDPDAALYWAFRMIDSGDDPRFLTRRMMIFASEDIGNADPRALQLAVATADAFERLGMPEGRIPLAQCVTYLACAPKSNRSYAAMHTVLQTIREHPKISVPKHLRNAPTKLMKSLDYGSGYQYPHKEDSGYVANEQYLPDELQGETFYEMSDRGYEGRMKEWMERIKEEN